MAANGALLDVSHADALQRLRPAPLTPAELKIVADAEELVKEHMKGYDPSHDWLHVSRVRLTALRLARSLSASGTPLDHLAVELSALFHDLTDAKYASSDTPMPIADVLAPFFTSHEASGGLPAKRQELICKVVENVSWSKEEKRRKRRENAMSEAGSLAEWTWTEKDEAEERWRQGCRELWCVSDADRLDAIGAFGIFRCAAFSSTRSTPLHLPVDTVANIDPTEGDGSAGGRASTGSSVGHFHDKLLRIGGDRLKTEEGRKEAQRRQTTMRHFLAELDREYVYSTSTSTSDA